MLLNFLKQFLEFEFWTSTQNSLLIRWFALDFSPFFFSVLHIDQPQKYKQTVELTCLKNWLILPLPMHTTLYRRWIVTI